MPFIFGHLAQIKNNLRSNYFQLKRCHNDASWKRRRKPPPPPLNLRGMVRHNGNGRRVVLGYRTDPTQQMMFSAIRFYLFIPE